MKSKYFIALCMPLLFLGFAFGCGNADEQNQASESSNIPGASDTDLTPYEPPLDITHNLNQPNEPSQPNDSVRHDILPSLTPGAIQATITMEDGGTITVELYPDIAPNTVRNFVYLVKQGFYDGLKFHRIISGFMIQGGCPDSTGMGGPGYFIKGEFTSNGFENNLNHDRGVLSMARRPAPNDSAGSQFFIMHSIYRGLDGDYAAFGRVLEGMDIVDLIAATPVYDDNGSVMPDDMPVIRSITIDSDVDLPEPDKIIN